MPDLEESKGSTAEQRAEDANWLRLADGLSYEHIVKGDIAIGNLVHSLAVMVRVRDERIAQLRVWATSDLERAQPKYGEYAEGLRNAQAVVLSILSGGDPDAQ